MSEQVRYSFRVDSSVCLSWDAQKGFWTHSSCRTMRTDASTSVNCRYILEVQLKLAHMQAAFPT